MPRCGAQWSISAGGHEAVVVEIGGGVSAYRVDGVDVLDGYDPDELCPGASGQILAPWPNRIRDGHYAYQGEPQQLPLTESDRHNAIHGLVNWVPWRRVEHSADAVTVECVLAAQPGYPWPLRLRTRWSVSGDGLRAEHEVTNVGARPCPFGFGVHPYFRVGRTAVNDLVLRVPARSRLLLDGRLLPIGAAKVAGSDLDFTAGRRIGAAVLDLAFFDVQSDPDGRSAVLLSTMEGDAGVRIWADGTFTWWQLFTGDTLDGARHRRSVAVEPMTCPPDAFRSGRDVITLQPGGTWTGSWGVTPFGPPGAAAGGRD